MAAAEQTTPVMSLRLLIGTGLAFLGPMVRMIEVSLATILSHLIEEA